MSKISAMHKKRNAEVFQQIKHGKHSVDEIYNYLGWSRQGIEQSLAHLQKVGKIVKDGHGEYYLPNYIGKPQMEETK